MQEANDELMPSVKGGGNAVMKKWSNTFQVGLYKCCMTYSKDKGLHCEWDPDLPKQDLSMQEWKQYRSGRDTLIAEIAKDLGGGTVLIIES